MGFWDLATTLWRMARLRRAPDAPRCAGARLRPLDSVVSPPRWSGRDGQAPVGVASDVSDGQAPFGHSTTLWKRDRRARG
jgi:hypothetical protein